MSAHSRNKGASGEREIARIVQDLTGWRVTRRCRQHDGDSDLQGVPGWSVEVKRHAEASRSEIRGWWGQACRQAGEGERPVLFFRKDRDEWRAVWLPHDAAGCFNATLYAWTVEGSIEAWAMFAREKVGE